MSQALSKAKVSLLKKYLMKKVRVESGLFLIEGWHLLDEALKAGRRILTLAYDPEARREAEEERILDAGLRVADEVFWGNAGALSQISDTKASQGVVALVEHVGLGFEKWIEGVGDAGALRIVVLDAVGDPGNVGSIVRTADWFGMDAVILGKGTAELENGKTVRATMGGLFHLPIVADVDLEMGMAALRAKGVSVVTTELDGAESLEGFGFPERCALVVGNEARGVSADVSALADAKVFAPRFGKGESLNAALAAAVFLGAWRMGGG